MDSRVRGLLLVADLEDQCLGDAEQGVQDSTQALAVCYETDVS